MLPTAWHCLVSTPLGRLDHPLLSSLRILAERNLTKVARSWRERCGCPRVTPASPPAILLREEGSRPNCCLTERRSPCAAGKRRREGRLGPTPGKGGRPVQQGPRCMDFSPLGFTQCLLEDSLKNMKQYFGIHSLQTRWIFVQATLRAAPKEAPRPPPC